MANPNLYYEVHGKQGPFLLLVHGFLSSRAQWMHNLGALSLFCRPVVVELYGHGRSPSPKQPECYSPNYYLQKFEEIRETLGVDQWFICGQSLGASLTLRYALNHPNQVIAQVFTNSRAALSDGPVRKNLPSILEELEQGGLKVISELPMHPSKARFLEPNVKQALVEDAKLVTMNGLINTLTHLSQVCSVREQIHKNKTPALLFAGKYEKKFTPYLEYAKENMPHLEVVQAEGGHSINIQAAELFNKTIKQFISRFVE